MKFIKFGAIFFIFFLQSCAWSPELKKPPTESFIPPVLILQDNEGRDIGKAIPFEDNIYVTPDHLWQTTGKLFFETKPIEVLVRDFQHDVLFFTLKNTKTWQTSWQSQPPSLGQSLNWFDGFQLHSATVIGTNETFFSEDEIIELMSIDGVLESGDSGTPLFDSEGKIYGMLISTDLEKNKSYFARSDVIRDLAEEYLD